MKKYDVLVIGAGAAGMTAAGAAARGGLKIALVERNDRVGRKLGITGKGRCNVTNNCEVDEFIKNIPQNGGFMYSSASRFTPHDTMELFESLGVPLKVERGNRVFPVSDRAADIVSALRRYTAEGGVDIIRGRAASLIIDGGELAGAALDDGRKVWAPAVVVACGGLSYPATGSTGDGYSLARQAGHTVTELRPSLVPLCAAGEDCRRLQGLSLRNVAVTVKNSGDEAVYRDFGELMFTHFGITGPTVLSASAHMRDFSRERYRFIIDLKPALDEQKLDERLLRDFAEFSRREFANSLDKLLPRKLIPVIIDRSGIDPSLRVNGITRGQRLELVRQLKCFEIEITGPRPIDEAIITSGGVCTKEINPRTMESRLLPGLYFAGEVIDVDAYTGGFNLQIAFSTAMAAAGALCTSV